MLFRKKKQDNITKGSWLKIEHNERSVLVQLSGNLNQTLSRELRESLEALIKQYVDRIIIINLSQIYFIDTTIAATLAEIAKQAQKRGTQLLMVDASPTVQKLFAGLGLENLLNGESSGMPLFTSLSSPP
jgi:anti-anti-sigma factor